MSPHASLELIGVPGQAMLESTFKEAQLQHRPALWPCEPLR